MAVHTAHLPLSICPNCGAEMDCASSASSDKADPVEGDLSICISCAMPLQFDKNLLLTELSDAEIVQLPPETQFDLRQAVRVVKQFIARKA